MARAFPAIFPQDIDRVLQCLDKHIRFPYITLYHSMAHMSAIHMYMPASAQHKEMLPPRFNHHRTTGPWHAPLSLVYTDKHHIEEVFCCDASVDPHQETITVRSLFEKLTHVESQHALFHRPIVPLYRCNLSFE